MSNKNGPRVFTATPEFATQMPKVFEAGVTYVVHRVVAMDLTAATPPPAVDANSSTKTKTAKAPAKAPAKAKKPKAKKKPPSRKTVRPSQVIGFVRKNEGCNMTDIEGHTHLPQAIIRQILNSARDSGAIRTEGQRRGLRYFGGAPKAVEPATASTDAS